ncbi:MAG: heparinase II/III family protein [Planctomycetes bacterium]|nr:heparinase II/III family protein [Planctomycetota bacterium]
MIAMFVANCRSPENVYLSGARTMNHLAVQASGAVCLALAIREDERDLACEIEIARAHLLRFLDWYDDAGGAIEIGSYWGFANEYVLRALLALKRHGWADIFHQRAMKLERYMYPTLCMSIGGKYVTNFCDGTYGDDIVYDGPGGDVIALARERVMPAGGDPRGVTFRTRSAALVLAAEFRDRRLQWMAERLPHGDELALISGDPELVASPPDDLPTTIVYHGCGVGILRSSMTDPDAIFLGLKAGRARGLVFDDPHCQSDLNTVVLDGFGTTLLADPGYRHDFHGSMSNLDPAHPSNSTPPHNTLLVAGAGQIHTDSPVAHLQDLSPSDDLDYIVSRIERGYGPDVLRFDRHAYLIAKRVVVLIDDIELSGPRDLCWNFHGKESAEVAASPSPTITCDGVRLRIIPFGLPLAVATASDHVLTRLRFDARSVARACVGWLLPIDRVGVDPLAVSAGFVDDHAQVQTLGRTWRLPVIVRRSSFRSDLMLPFPRK